MADEILKVKMLGNFSIEYQGRAISVERNNRTKTNQLLQLLLYFREGIAREQLIHELFLNEQVTNPSNSLRALVFRLRKNLKEQNLPGEEFVTVKQQIYSFTPDCRVECDIHKFEEMAERALAESDSEKRYLLLCDSCERYTGEFLPELGAVDWVVILNVKFKKMYTACVKELCEESVRRKEYQKLLSVAAKASAIYPFDGWQTYQMEALIGLNQSKEAIRLYEETEQMMFEELGAALPQSMTEQMKKLGKQVRNNTDLLTDVLENVAESGRKEGAYECAFPNFVETYHLISRMIERTGQSAWLLLCTITDGKGYALEAGVRLEELQQELGNAVAQTLRRGDMYTRYSDNQYLILLLEINQEDCRIVMDRISEHMKVQSRKKYLQYHIAPVNGEQIREKKLQILNNEFGWSKKDEYSK